MYDWTGKIRELLNVTERAVILSTNGRLKLDLLETIPSSYGCMSKQTRA